MNDGETIVATEVRQIAARGGADHGSVSVRFGPLGADPGLRPGAHQCAA